ncbi:MAG: YdeI/OmpD-associated family protein [Pseudomonadota bacterium]
MAATDPRIDAYIAKSADFARPILEHLRAVAHAACPTLEETMKWSTPHFTYNGLLCHMAAFKAHCAFGFWKGELIVAQADPTTQSAMGQFGRITSIADLPPKATLVKYIKAAMKLNDDGVKAPAREKPATSRALDVPDYLAAALAAAEPALANFNAFTTGQKREYVEWLAEAKTEATRLRRLEQAVEWIAEAKTRNWKYAKC